MLWSMAVFGPHPDLGKPPAKELPDLAEKRATVVERLGLARRLVAVKQGQASPYRPLQRLAQGAVVVQQAAARGEAGGKGVGCGGRLDGVRVLRIDAEAIRIAESVKR